MAPTRSPRSSGVSIFQISCLASLLSASLVDAFPVPSNLQLYGAPPPQAPLSKHKHSRHGHSASMPSTIHGSQDPSTAWTGLHPAHGRSGAGNGREDEDFVEVSFRSVRPWPLSGEDQQVLTLPIGRIIDADVTASLPRRPTRASIIAVRRPSIARSHYSQNAVPVICKLELAPNTKQPKTQAVKADNQTEDAVHLENRNAEAETDADVQAEPPAEVASADFEEGQTKILTLREKDGEMVLDNPDTMEYRGDRQLVRFGCFA